MTQKQFSRYLNIDQHIFKITTTNSNILSVLEQRWFFLAHNPASNKLFVINLDSQIYRNALAMFKQHKGKYLYIDCVDFLTMVEIEKYLITKNIILLHGSVVILKNKAVVFLGPSGSGKSTILSRLKHLKTLAEDTVIIKKLRNKFYILPTVFDRDKICSSGSKGAMLDQINCLIKKQEDRQIKLQFKQYLNCLIKNDLYIMKNGLNQNKKLHRLLLELVISIPGYKFEFKKCGILDLLKITP